MGKVVKVKFKRPFYKKLWFYILLAAIAIKALTGTLGFTTISDAYSSPEAFLHSAGDYNAIP